MNTPTKTQVEEVVGPIESWLEEPNAYSFRPFSTITFKQLAAISELFGTERIDLYHGREGEPGYSEDTPGISAEPGEITVYKDPPRPQQLKLEDVPLGLGWAA